MATNEDRLNQRWADAKQNLVDAAHTAGLDPAVMVKIAGFESGFNPHARPIAGEAKKELNTVTQFDGKKAMSSAYGYGQFLNKTWANMVREYGDKYGVENAANLTDAQTNTAAMRNDTRLQAGMLAEFTRENAAKGAALGGPDAAANVYAMHNLGGGDGPTFLKALAEHPHAKVNTVLSATVIERNASLYGSGNITVAQAYKNMGAQMDKYQKYADEVAQGRTAPTPASQANPTSHSAASTHHDRAAPVGNLSQGARGENVTTIQNQLNQLGIKDAHGHALRADGNFGPATKAAVEAFQEKHHMVVDGVVGKVTLSQLRSETQAQVAADKANHAAAPQLNQPEHKDYGMFKQALAGVEQIDAAHGRKSDLGSVNLAGTLVVSSLAAGMNRIDNVALSDDATRAFAVQGAANSPLKQYAEVNVTQGIATSIAQSTQAVQNLQTSQQTQQVAEQTQQQTQQQQQNQQPMHH